MSKRKELEACIRMWEWIRVQLAKPNFDHVQRLKYAYIEGNPEDGKLLEQLTNLCYFCHYYGNEDNDSATCSYMCPLHSCIADCAAYVMCHSRDINMRMKGCDIIIKKLKEEVVN